MAAILWPKIIALAREEKYGEASKLLEIAVGYKGTVAEFREDILLFWPPDPATGSWAPTEDGDDQARTGLKDESK